MCICPGRDKMKKEKSRQMQRIRSALQGANFLDPTFRSDQRKRLRSKKTLKRRFRDILTSSTVPVSKVDKLVKRP